MLCGDGESTAGFSGHSTVFMDSSVYSCLILKGGNMETLVCVYAYGQLATDAFLDIECI